MTWLAHSTAALPTFISVLVKVDMAKIINKTVGWYKSEFPQLLNQFHHPTIGMMMLDLLPSSCFFFFLLPRPFSNFHLWLLEFDHSGWNSMEFHQSLFCCCGCSLCLACFLSTFFMAHSWILFSSSFIYFFTYFSWLTEPSLSAGWGSGYDIISTISEVRRPLSATPVNPVRTG